MSKKKYYTPSPRNAYRTQRNDAKRRGIEWGFTFEGWVSWWERNLGRNWFSKRGRGKGKYCMARIGDRGPYAEINVKCILYEDNSVERKYNGTSNKGRITKESTKELMRESILRTHEQKFWSKQDV